MKIGMVAWSFYPRVGGSATSTFQLAEALQRKDIKVEIIAPLCQRDMPKVARLGISKDIKIHWVVSSIALGYTDFFSRAVFFLKMVLVIRKLSKQIDIFHAHDFNISFFSAIIGTKKPVVSVFGADPLLELFYFKKKKCPDYNLFLQRKAIRLLQWLMRLVISLVARNNTVVISLNSSIDQIIRKYYSGWIVNIYVGIDLNLYKKTEPVNMHECENILVVARFVPWKNVEKAIEVYKEIRKYKRNSRLICIGEGPLKDYLFSKYKDAEGLVFIEDLDYREVIKHYKNCGVLLVTSKYETFGINITEAMAAGLPIIASDLEVFHDRLINDVNCYLVKDGDINSFANKVLGLMENRDIRERFINNALATVKNYDVHKIADQYISLYNSLVSL